MDPQSISYSQGLSSSQRLTSGAQESLAVKREIPERILRQLQDRNYDRRKQAGSELQRILKVPFQDNARVTVGMVLEFFRVEYLQAPTEQSRKAGLMAYSALAMFFDAASAEPAAVAAFLQPVVACARSSDSKVKYYAVETLYNIVKACRQYVLVTFHSLIQLVFDLFTDPDGEVKRAAERLDSLLKTVLLECEADATYFDSSPFMELIKTTLVERRQSSAQQLVVSWLRVLDSIPNFNILVYLPMFIEGLFLMLKSPNVQQAASRFLAELLEEIHEVINDEVVDLMVLVDSMVRLSQHESLDVRLEANKWIYHLIDISGSRLFPKYPDAMIAILECLSDEQGAVVDIAQKANSRILEQLGSASDPKVSVDFTQLMHVLITYLEHPSNTTKLAALDWITTIQRLHPDSLESCLQSLLTNLTRRLNETNSNLIVQVLFILSNIANYKNNFDVVMNSVIELFIDTKESVTINRKLIITTLCLNLGMERVYTSFAESLLQQSDTSFCKTLVETQCGLLLSSEEFHEERERLKYCIENDDQECIAFFESLFKAWSVNPGATLVLTYLVQSYYLAYEMLKILAKCKIDVQLLKQLLWLVHLLDSPTFVRKIYTDLRLQMLENDKHPFLLRSLYAILVFLPTSQAHQSLQLRLKGVANLQQPEFRTEDAGPSPARVDFSSLIQCFKDKNLPKHRKRLQSVLSADSLSGNYQV